MKPRYFSIDLLRALAIVLMIQVHFVEYLSTREDGSGWLYDTSMILGSLSAPFFTFLSGVSYSLWVWKQEDVGLREREVTRRTLRRGAFLFALGLVFNCAIWLPEETFNWDILTLLGTAYLFLAVARKLPGPVLALMCVAVLLASPPLRVVGDYASYWRDYEYSYDFTARDVLFGFVANGYFPVFPWIVFPVAGFVGGNALFRRRRRNGTPQRWAVAFGLGLLAVAAVGVAFGSRLPAVLARFYADGATEFPASTWHVLGMIGLNLVALVALHRWLDRPAAAPRTGRFAAAVFRWSAFSLTVYVLHHMALLWPLWVAGAATGHDDSTVFWRSAASAPVALGLAAVCLIVCHFALFFFERRPRYALESVMRRVCDGPDPKKV